MDLMLLREALYNTHHSNIRDERDVRYARGIVHGIYTVLFSTNESNAISIIADLLPVGYIEDCMTPAMLKEVKEKRPAKLSFPFKQSSVGHCRTDAKLLLAFTDGVRDDFHEPDEQNISLSAVVGTRLDNAFGNNIDQDFLNRGLQEAVIILQRETPDGDKHLRMNLATTLALACHGAKNL